jgi:hypothetical protein
MLRVSTGRSVSIYMRNPRYARALQRPSESRSHARFVFTDWIRGRTPTTYCPCGRSPARFCRKMLERQDALMRMRDAKTAESNLREAAPGWDSSMGSVTRRTATGF